jgi:alpha-L-rhamnosidase
LTYALRTILRLLVLAGIPVGLMPGFTHRSPAAETASSAKAVDLRCEGLHNPLGIDSDRPAFSWRMEDERRGAKQTGYRILVASSKAKLANGSADIWDSGKIASGGSLNISYGGPVLKSRQRYYWAVTIWDQNGAPSSPSIASWWEMGLLDRSDWKAQWVNRSDPEFAADRSAGVKWIWSASDDQIKAEPKTTRYFRYNLNFPALPRSATLLVSGKDSMEAVVNGKSVGKSDTWGTFDVIDISREIKKGENVISVAVTAAGAPAGMAALLKWTNRDGTIERVPSDSRWQVSTAEGSGYTAAVVVANLAAKPIGNPWPAQPASYFRKAFTADKQVSRARLYVTALGSYRAFLNGHRVGEDILTPGWTDYGKRVQYQTYDVTQLVQSGVNRVGAVLGDGWYASGLGWKLQRYAFGPPPVRILMQLDIVCSDGSQQMIATDGSWRASTGAILSSEIYAGENFDARKITAWDSASFDANSWAPVQINSPPDALLTAQRDQTIQQTQAITPKAISSPSPGVYVFDLGQNMVGWAQLKVKGQAGTRVTMRFAEILRPDGNIYRDNLRAAKATDTYILRGEGDETFEPHFTYHGFRYVEVTGYPGKPDLSAVTGIVFHNNMPETGTFESSSDLVNRIWQNVVWGQRGNLMSVPTDCPQRDERLGWMADAQIFWQTASYNMDMDAFTHKWMRDVRDAQSNAGAFSDVSPRIVDDRDGAPAWGDAGVIIPWTTWQQYGDLGVVRDNWSAMKKWLEYIQRANPNYLWENQRNNDFGDWVPANSETPKDLLATAFWAYDAELMNQMAHALGKDAEAAEYQQLYSEVKAAFIQKFVRPDGTVGNGSQTCYVLALHMKLLPDNLREAAADHLVRDIQSRDWHLSTGFAGTSLLMQVLSDNGKNDVAYRLVLNTTYPSWGYMVNKDATTMWERWNGDTGDPSMNSFNHYAFGAVGAWMYQRMLGIASDPAAPGFQRIIIHPRPDNRIASVSGSYNSPYGRISTHWSTGAGKPFILSMTIPANMTALVYLPTAAGSRVTENGAPLGSSITQAGQERGDLIYQVPAGRYQFEVRQPSIQ